MDTRRVLGISFLALAASFESSAATVFTSFSTPFTPAGVPTLLSLGSITPPSQTAFAGSGYSVSFSSVAGDQGVVQGPSPFGPPFSFFHAVPVAGDFGGTPLYLTGDAGSPLTTDINQSGKYFSTGLGGTITFNFTSPHTQVALLWGSVDAGNQLVFNDAASTTITGNQIHSLTPGITAGGQTFGGSTWVLIQTDTPFTSFSAFSSNISFEFAGVIASPVPEPGSFYLVSSVLCIGALMLLRRSLRQV